MDVPAGIANDYIAGLNPGAPALWTFCQSCLRLLKDLIAKVLQASNISVSVKPYFDPITRHLDNNLIRLEIWIFDTGIDDKDFQQASMSARPDTKLERCVTSILEDTLSQLKVIEEQVEHMRAIASAILEDPNLPNQSFGLRKPNHQLDEVLKQVKKSCQHIASAVDNLVDLAEAVRMCLATKYQCGPLAGLREQMRRSRDQVPVMVNLSEQPSEEQPSREQPSEEQPFEEQPSEEQPSKEQPSEEQPFEEQPSEEDGPWTRKNLLTLDGGGVKNYSTLLILEEIMSYIAQEEQNGLPAARSSAFPLDLRPKNWSSSIRKHGPATNTSQYFPCHYFDYIAGSGFGGILAIMLGRLRMTVDECLDAYGLLFREVFPSGRTRQKLLKVKSAIASGGSFRYDHKLLEHELKRITEDRQLGSSFQQLNEDMCRTIVITSSKVGEGTQIPYLFRSYYHPRNLAVDTLERNPGRQNDHKIWRIGRATSASPRYFESMKFEELGEHMNFFDKNPSEEAYRSVRQVNHNDQQAVKVLVSIGTGRNAEAEQRSFSLLGSTMTMSALDSRNAEKKSEDIHRTLLDATENNAEYFRLNVKRGLEPMAFDEWKGKEGHETLKVIQMYTQLYLASMEGITNIANIAKQLVDIRRERSTWKPDPDRWERFCHGVEYACPVSTCSDGARRHKTRQNLQDHLKATHSIHPDELEPMLDAGKRFPLEEISE